MKKTINFRQYNAQRLFAFVFLTCLLAQSMVAQMKYWTLLPTRYDMTPATPAATTLTGAPTGQYGHGNGAYDEAGNVLFYVRDGDVHNASGTVAGTLATLPNSTGYLFQGLQIGIVPKPGTCSQFYIIYTRMNVQGGTALLFMEVNATNPNAVTFSSNTATSIGHFNGVSVGFAISEITSGSGSTAKRYLFGAGGEYLKRFQISDTGIGSEVTLASISTAGFATVGFSTCELEYVKTTSTTGKLAWGNEGGNVGKVYRVDLNSTYELITGSLVATTLPANSGSVRGLEFTTGTSPKLYVSSGNMDVQSGNLTEPTIGGIYQINGNTVTAVANTVQLSATQLERAINGKIYGVRAIFTGGALASTKLVGINTATNALSSDVNYTTGYGNWTNGGYVWETFTLPHQIDSENYTYFFGEPKVTLASVNIGGNTNGTVCTTPNELYNCVPISFAATYNGGTPTQYKFVIQATNTSCQVMTGAAYMNYQGTYTTGTPTANLDLRTLTDAAGKNLQNVTGRHVLIYYIKDACGNENSMTRYLNVSAAPSPVGILMFNLGNGISYNACQASPPSNCNVFMGNDQGSINLANSTGIINYYKVISITEVNCANGGTINSIPANPNQQNVANVSTLIGIEINFLTLTGNWFSSQPAGYFPNRCFKLVIRVGNACNFTDVWSYFKINEAFLRGAGTDRGLIGTGSEFLGDDPPVTVTPNPFGDYIEFSTRLQMGTDGPKSQGQLLLTDIAGRVVALLDSEGTSAGKATYRFDAQTLENGIYFYRLTSNGRIYSGKVVKSN